MTASLYKIGQQITLTLSPNTLVLTTASGAFNGVGYQRTLVNALTNQVGGYTARNQPVIQGSNGLVWEFLFDLNLRRTQWRTLWRMFIAQQSSKAGILLQDEYWPLEGSGSPTYSSFLIWIGQPPIEISGSVPNTNVGTGMGCQKEVLHRVAFSATEV
jgi:hypothetical protein